MTSADPCTIDATAATVTYDRYNDYNNRNDSDIAHIQQP